MHLNSSAEPKKAMCFKQHYNNEAPNNLTLKQLISEVFISCSFLKMHNLYIIWLYALQFVTSKVSVDAFSLLYSKLLHAKLSVFVCSAILLSLIGKFLAYVAVLLVTSDFRLLSLRG